MHSTVRMPRLIFIGFLTLVVVATGAFIYGFRSEATFAVQALGSLSVLLAVLTALYGNLVREIVQPLEVRIETTQTLNTSIDLSPVPPELALANGAIIGGGPWRAYCHHLQVMELNRQRQVENCRVWLTRILVVQKNGDTQEPLKFAVPRLMPWAPAEFSPTIRSFAGSQVFDFGKYYPEFSCFEPARQQGGNSVGGFNKGAQRYVFRIEVAGFMRDREHQVDVEIEPCDATPEWPYATRAKITARN
jgi:hypothetical protein